VAKVAKKTVKNVSGQAYALPGGQYIGAGEEITITSADWDAQAENETVKAWLDEGHLEISDAAEPEEGDDLTDQEKMDLAAEESRKRDQEASDQERGASAASTATSRSKKSRASEE
jgi:hypothetical protein